jgi:hypothetical protein
MKNLRLTVSLVSALLVVSLSLAAQAPATENQKAIPGFYNTTVGIQLGTYRSPDSRFQEVYGNKTSLQPGLNLTRTLLYVQGFQVDLSLEAREFSRTGAATLGGEQTKISVIPLSAAGRLLYQTDYVIPFIGAGGDWYHYNEESTIANTSGWARGYHFQGGVYIVIPGAESLRVKIYYKYTKVTATANEIAVKLGGPEYGIGLSFGFNFADGGVLVIQ